MQRNGGVVDPRDARWNVKFSTALVNTLVSQCLTMGRTEHAAYLGEGPAQFDTGLVAAGEFIALLERTRSLWVWPRTVNSPRSAQFSPRW